MVLKQKETDLHKAFWQWAQYNKDIEPYLFHIEHGVPYSRDKQKNFRMGAFLKARGVKPGMPDFYFMKPNSIYSGLFLEFKLKPNKLSPAQQKFFKLAPDCDRKCVCVYSVDEAIKELKDYVAI